MEVLMGCKSKSFVHRVKRRGKSLLIIDIRFGEKSVYKRDAKVQNVAAAEAEATRRWLAYLNDGTPELPDERPAKASTVQAFIDSYFSPVYMETAYTPGSRRAYKSHLKDIEAHYGHLRFDQISHLHHQTFVQVMAERGVQARKPLALLRTIIKQSVDTRHSAVMAPLPHLPKQPYREIDLPSDDTVAACFAEASGYLRHAIVLGACCGLRKGEVRALRVGDIDRHAGWVSVRRAYSEGDLKTPKSGDERRVRIYTEMFGCEPFAMLDEACKGRGRDASVLRGPSGDAPCAVSIDEALHRLQRRLGTPEHKFHCFRHWFATTLLRRGVNIEAVRRMMGHSSLAVTQRYLHLVGTDYDPAPSSSGHPLFGPKSGD
jgi:integrase